MFGVEFRRSSSTDPLESVADKTRCGLSVKHKQNPSRQSAKLYVRAHTLGRRCLRVLSWTLV